MPEKEYVFVGNEGDAFSLRLDTETSINTVI